MSRRPPRAPPRAPLLLLGVLLASARANAAPAACAALERLPGLCAPRASGDPPPPLAAPNGAAPWPRAADACCEALRALDDAACFCRPAFLALPPRRRSAFVPALARAPGRCGVTPSLTPERCAARARRGAASGADDASGIETETTPPRAVTILQAREPAGSEPTRVSPPPLSPTQPRVLPPAPATPAREDSPGAPSPRVPPPPFRTPPPPGNNDRALDETVRCDAETVQKLVLDGCASALNASRESSPGTGTPGTAARARARAAGRSRRSTERGASAAKTSRTTSSSPRPRASASCSSPRPSSAPSSCGAGGGARRSRSPRSSGASEAKKTDESSISAERRRRRFSSIRRTRPFLRFPRPLGASPKVSRPRRCAPLRRSSPRSRRAPGSLSHRRRTLPRGQVYAASSSTCSTASGAFATPRWRRSRAR